MAKRYTANDTPRWIIEQLQRVNYDKLTGTEIEKAASSLNQFANISFLKRKKSKIETVWIDTNVPQSILDTVSQIDWNAVSNLTQNNFEKMLQQYITTHYAGKLL